MRWKHFRLCRRKCLLFFAACFLPCLAIELLSFWITSLFWRLPKNLRAPNSTVVLAVADPQLIGTRNEPNWIGWLSRWDADRFLWQGFAQASSVIKPDLEVFLGDIFDEGIFLDDSQFGSEKSRFLHIFPLDESQNRVYLPGDNDIGGEMEPVYTGLERRFGQKFQDHINFESHKLRCFSIFKKDPIEHAKINGIFGDSGTKAEENGDKKQINLLLSHFPVIPFMSAEIEQELRKINVILSGHDHTPALYMQWRSPPSFRHTASAMDVADASWTISMDEPASLPLIEFKVPTCSYRMGVPAMGYGVLVFTPWSNSRTATVQYSVLWLPRRFVLLLLYTILLSTLPIGWLFFSICGKFAGRRKRDCCDSFAVKTEV